MPDYDAALEETRKRRQTERLRRERAANALLQAKAMEARRKRFWQEVDDHHHKQAVGDVRAMLARRFCAIRDKAKKEEE